MRIGIVVNTFGHSGGMETYALNIIRMLLNLGHTPIIYCKKCDTSMPLYEHCEVHIYPCPWWMPHKLHVRFFDRWYENERRNSNISFAIGCAICSGPEVQVCGWTHLGYCRAMNREPRFYDQWLIKIEHQQWAKAKFIIAHANNVRNELIQYYSVKPEKIDIIYPPQQWNTKDPVDREKRTRLRIELGLPTDKTLFLFPSCSHKRKGFDLISKYFENTNNNYCLIVAGRPIKNKFKNIRYIGYSNNIQDLYQASDYTVLASKYDPLGTVGLESVYCGTPAILSNPIGCLDILDPKAVRKFDPSDYGCFSNVMDNLSSQPIILDYPYSKYISEDNFEDLDEHVNHILKRMTELESVTD